VIVASVAIARFCPTENPCEQPTDGEIQSPTDDEVVAELDRRPVEHEKRVALIRELELRPSTHSTIRMLVREIEVYVVNPNGVTDLSFGEPGELESISTIPVAAGGLARRPDLAAELLVTEYVAFFERTKLADWPHRNGTMTVDAEGRPTELQDPSRRLRSIWQAAVTNRQLAVAVVRAAEQAQSRAAATSRAHRACAALVQEVLANYDQPDHAEAFPGREPR